MMDLGLKLEDVRQEVLNLLGAGVEGESAALGMKMGPQAGRKPKRTESVRNGSSL